MDFNTQSAHAAVLGAAYGVPLLLCSVAARTKLFKRSFPVLDQLHRQQADLQGHFTAGNSNRLGPAVTAPAPAVVALLVVTDLCCISATMILLHFSS